MPAHPRLVLLAAACAVAVLLPAGSAAAGVSVPSDTATPGLDAGALPTAVSSTEPAAAATTDPPAQALRPGDLVLYDTCPQGGCPYKHVVMYLGRPGGVGPGWMLHTNACGDVAKVEPFWGFPATGSHTFLVARRVVPVGGEKVAAAATATTATKAKAEAKVRGGTTGSGT